MTSTVHEIDCELNYEVLEPSTFVFNIEAIENADQRIVEETLTTLPPLSLSRETDVFGNRLLKLAAPSGPLSVRYQAVAEVQNRARQWSLPEIEVKDLPLDVMCFLLASRYCESDLLFHDALAWIGTERRGYDRVKQICEWVRANIEYRVGTSMPHGTARDVLRERTGVCRDYAHVAIALCRALGIPARFVTGHVEWDTPPTDFHALFEAWLGGQWVLFDPTEMADTNDLIRIGTGRDAADVAFATIFGRAIMQRMNPDVRRGHTADERARLRGQAPGANANS